MFHSVKKNLFSLLLLLAVSSAWGQVTILHPEKDSIHRIHRIAVIIMGKPGSEARCFINDELASAGTIRIDGKYDFLNVEVPDGPVTIRVEARGARNRLYKAEQNIHVTGSVDSLIFNPAALSLPAGGQSRETIHVDVRDAWGVPVERLLVATVETGGGGVVETDLDSLTPGAQISTETGSFRFVLRAQEHVGRETVTVSIDGKTAAIPVQYTTPNEPFILVGSAGAGLSAARRGADEVDGSRFSLSDFRTGETEKKGLLGFSHAAFYAKGTIWNKYRVTASYDSRRRLDNQLFRDLDPNEQYALYGDASSMTYDAMSQSKFFGKIERNESFLVFGDFNTQMRSTEFAAYDRTFNGLMASLKTENHTLTGFATLNDRKMRLDEIRGEGISGYYMLSASHITINSDKVRIEIRDRYHPEIVLQSTEKVRFQDYDINYVDGTLMFKQPVPAIDAEGNPYYIVASYEYKTNEDRAVIGGMRYEGRFFDRIQLGTTFILEEQTGGNYMLYGMDAALPLTSWLTFTGEYAGSRSPGLITDKEQGSAYRAEFSLRPFKALQFRGYYRQVDKDFLNPSLTGSQFNLGGEKVGVSGDLKISQKGSLRSEWYHQTNQEGTVNENRVDVIKSYYEHQLNEKLGMKLGYEKAGKEQAGSDSVTARSYNSELLKGQVTYQLTRKLASTLEHEQNLSDEDNAMPTATSLGLKYALSDKLDLFLKYRLIESENRRSQTVIGFNSRLLKSTKLLGKYEIGGAAGEQLNRATLGLHNRWQVRKDLTLNLAYESTATMDSLEVPTPDHHALSAAFEYLPAMPWKSFGKYEMRKDPVVLKQIISLGTEFKIWNGMALIYRMDYAHSKYDDSRDVWIRGNYQLGMAYRPELTDWFNSVAKIQYLTDKNTHIEPGTRLNRLIGSVHGYWQPASWLEFGGRFALRYLLDEEMDTYENTTLTELYALRTEAGLGLRWSLGMDFRMIRLRPLRQTKTGASVDVHYLLMKNTQIGVGYILKQLSDPDFSCSEYQFANWYLSLRVKFSEDIFNWR